MSDVVRLLALFPDLRCVTEDPVHGKIRLEKCSGGPTDQVSTVVQGINMEFSHDPKEREASESFRWSAGAVARDGEEAKVAYRQGLTMSAEEATLLCSEAIRMVGSAT